MRNIAEEVLMGINTHETLVHSDEYLGAEYDEGLRHWKYIKRYRSPKSGKWVYVYADKGTHGRIGSNVKLAEVNKNATKVAENFAYGGKPNPVSSLVRAKQSAKDANYFSKAAEEDLEKYDFKKKIPTVNEIKRYGREIVNDGFKIINNILSKLK